MLLLLLTASLSFASASLASLPPGGEAQAESKNTCPDKWVDATFVDLGCLYFNTTEPLTWDDASSMCQMVSNATLVEIKTETQMEFIQMELMVIEDHEHSHFYWWTAATDVGINGRWFWIASLTAVEDFVWDSSYPSSQANYNCMQLHYSRGYLGYNQPCDQNEFPICQLKL